MSLNLAEYKDEILTVNSQVTGQPILQLKVDRDVGILMLHAFDTVRDEAQTLGRVRATNLMRNTLSLIEDL